MLEQPDRKSHKMEQKAKKDSREVRGYMALRNNVWKTRSLLWRERNPLELCLLDLIIDRTIGWRQKEAKIKMEDFVEWSGRRKDKVYYALTGLLKDQIIFKRKNEHSLFFSLNEDYFGGLLIKRHEEALQKRLNNVKLAVDNSKKVDLNQVQARPKLGPPLTQLGSKKEDEDIETIGEFRPLNTFFKDTSLKPEQKTETGKESFTLLGREEKSKRTREEHEKIVLEQLSELKKTSTGG